MQLKKIPWERSRPKRPTDFILQELITREKITVTDVAKGVGKSEQELLSILHNNKPLPSMLCVSIARFFGLKDDSILVMQARYITSEIVRGNKAKLKGIKTLDHMKREEHQAKTARLNAKGWNRETIKPAAETSRPDGPAKTGIPAYTEKTPD